jgi:hypothetical protein
MSTQVGNSPTEAAPNRDEQLNLEVEQEEARATLQGLQGLSY